MGDCDRLKNYISDYLEGNLDNTTRQEFERAIRNDSDLRHMTNRIEKLSAILTKLPEYKCSEDFNLRLRERIHNESKKKRTLSPVKKFSFAFSLVIVLAIVAISLNDTTNNETPVNDIPASSRVKSIQPDHVGHAPVQPATKIKADNRQVDIQAIPANKAVEDSLNRSHPQRQTPKNIKQVDTIKK